MGTPVTKVDVNGEKIPKSTEQIESFFGKNPSWRFAKADVDHPKWSVLDSHEDIVLDPSDPSGTSILNTFSKSIDKELLEGLKSRESMFWSQLFGQSGGRKAGTNSHNIPIHELIKEAQDRATELRIETDQLFSLRVDGKKRIFGILEDGVLNVIWFDREHEICPSYKK